jgi:prevent-host-death family protein
MTNKLVRNTIMTRVSLAEAKSRLSALVTRAENGETIVITRRGKTVATLAPPEPAPARERVDVEWLRSVTGAMTSSPVSAAEIVRQLRDEARY